MLSSMNVRTRSSWPVAFCGLLLAGCMQAGPGACSSEERAVFDSIEHFDGMPLEAEDHATGACGGGFQTTDAQAVIDHYQRELVSDGWLIGVPGTQPDGEDVVFPPGVLQAQRGDMSFSVTIPQAGADRGSVTVLVGEGL